MSSADGRTVRQTILLLVSNDSDHENTVMKAKQIINHGHDLIQPRWVIDCIERGDLIPLSKKCVP